MNNPYPGLPEFEYVKPASLKEASEFLAGHVGEARPLLGGTDSFVRMRDGVLKVKYLVDIKGLEGTNEISFDPKQGLVIGAAVNMNRVAASPLVEKHYPLLAQAARTVASYQLRTRATIVGNICNASPAGDTIGSCIVLQGSLRVFGKNGVRVEPLSKFFLGPGKTVLQPGDIVTALLLPPPVAGGIGKYIKLGRNKLSDLSVVGVTAFGYPDKTAKSGYRFRFALASVAPVPFVPVQAEEVLADEKITEETIKKAAQAAMDSIKPIDDVRGSAAYRKHMVRNLVQEAATEIWRKLAA